jgi:glucosamine-6-phosphate deaminase
MGLDASRTAEVAHGIEAALRSKRPGEVDGEAVLRTKALIRQCEARSAGRTCGADVANLHFLNMPFYQTGGRGQVGGGMNPGIVT